MTLRLKITFTSNQPHLKFQRSMYWLHLRTQYFHVLAALKDSIFSPGHPTHKNGCTDHWCPSIGHHCFIPQSHVHRLKFTSWPHQLLLIQNGSKMGFLPDGVTKALRIPCVPQVTSKKTWSLVNERTQLRLAYFSALTPQIKEMHTACKCQPPTATKESKFKQTMPS